jgi:hypothetical protein
MSFYWRKQGIYGSPLPSGYDKSVPENPSIITPRIANRKGVESWESPGDQDLFPGIPWTPEKITTEAWYDATDSDTITESGGEVTLWADKSGNGYDMFPDSLGVMPATDSPITNSRTLNNLNVLAFDGAATGLKSATGPINDGDAMMLAVVDWDGWVPPPVVGDETRQRIFNGQSTLGTRFAVWIEDPLPDSVVNEYVGYVQASSFGSYILTTQSPLTGSNLFSGYRNGLVGASGLNGEYTTGSASDTPTVNRWLIGYYQDNVTKPNTGRLDFFNGGIAEIVIVKQYDEELRQKLEGYLTWKWGLIDNLPSNHPYKNARPEI